MTYLTISNTLKNVITKKCRTKLPLKSIIDDLLESDESSND
jgi:hypothetical protein